MAEQGNIETEAVQTGKIEMDFDKSEMTRELTEAEKEFLKRINYIITEDREKKEISIIPCNELNITLHSVSEAKLFKKILLKSIQSVFGI